MSTILVVIGLLVLVAASIFSKRLGVATPILLVVVGIGYSFVPGAAQIDLSPEVVLGVLLPLLLYAASVQVPLSDFRRNLGGISMLSVVLVIVSAVVIGLVLSALLPELSLASAIALGAVVSPTDAVAATAVAKRLGLPARDVTMLEGESLLNDATALVLLKSAIAATASAVSLVGVAGSFALSVVVSVVLGLVVGFVTVRVRSRFTEPVIDTVVSFVVPFVAFLPAEALHASGALSVVVAGIYSGHNGLRKLSARARLSEQLNWRTVAFIIENGVFLLMGTQLLGLVHDAVRHPDIGLAEAIGLGLLTVLALLVIRAIVVVPVVLSIRRAAAQAADQRAHVQSMRSRMRSMTALFDGSERIRRRAEVVERRLDRRDADMVDLQRNRVGWRDGIVLTWAGMRGVVTLAAAQSLPTDTPYRAQLILLAFVVAIVSLVVQGSTLPLIIRITGIRGSDAAAEQRELVALLGDVAAAAERALDDADLEQLVGEKIDPEVVAKLRAGVRVLADSAQERADADGDTLSSPYAQRRKVWEVVLAAEREALLEARSTAAYSSSVLGRVQRILDRDEAQLERDEGF